MWKHALYHYKLSVSIVLVLCAQHAVASDSSCPKPPEQLSKDSQAKVAAAVAKIGVVKGPNLDVQTQITTRDLMGGLPDGNSLYLEQMMFSEYCNILHAAKDISDMQKLELIQKYRANVLGTINQPAPEEKKIIPENQRGAIKSSNAKKIAETTCDSIVDKKTNLEWYIGPDRNTSWDEARKWAMSLKACGGGWRMPTALQLVALYQPHSVAGIGFMTGGKHWPAHIDPAFSAIGGGSWVWTKESRGPKAWAVNLNQNVPVIYEKNNTTYETRAFAVRDAAAKQE